MLSFFSKKKSSPDTPAEAVVHCPADPQNGNGDDFIFIERKEDSDIDPQDRRSMYPPMPAAPFGLSGLPYPASSLPGHTSSKESRADINSAPIHYVQGVPFELAPQLCTKGVFEETQMQVDGILALITRQMSVDERDDYNFTLERSIQNEYY